MNVEGVHPLHLYREKKGKKEKKMSEKIGARREGETKGRKNCNECRRRTSTPPIQGKKGKKKKKVERGQLVSMNVKGVHPPHLYREKKRKKRKKRNKTIN